MSVVGRESVRRTGGARKNPKSKVPTATKEIEDDAVDEESKPWTRDVPEGPIFGIEAFIDVLAPMTVVRDTQNMTDKELAEELKKRGLDATGTRKAKLIRLEQALYEEGLGKDDRTFRKLQALSPKPAWLNNPIMKAGKKQGSFS